MGLKGLNVLVSLFTGLVYYFPINLPRIQLLGEPIIETFHLPPGWTLEPVLKCLVMIITSGDHFDVDADMVGKENHKPTIRCMESGMLVLSSHTSNFSKIP